MIIIATFSQVTFNVLSIPVDAIIHPISTFAGHNLGDFIQSFQYIPQIAAVLFTGALLGPRLGLLAIGIYIFLGIIGLPVFAMGGGVKYVAQVGFGYILGYLIGAFIVGHLLLEKSGFLSTLKAGAISVTAIHLTGIVYLTSLLLINNEPFSLIVSWIWLLSGMQIFFDILISTAAIALAKPVRGFLWFALS